MILDITMDTIALIGAGAVTNAAVSMKRARDAETKFDLIDLVIAAVIAAFAGMMYSIGGDIATDDETIIAVCGGFGAFVGLTGLEKTTDLLFGFAEAWTKARSKG